MQRLRGEAAIFALAALGAAYKFRMDDRWSDLSQEARDAILYGTGDKEMRFAYADGTRAIGVDVLRPTHSEWLLTSWSTGTQKEPPSSRLIIKQHTKHTELSVSESTSRWVKVCKPPVWLHVATGSSSMGTLTWKFKCGSWWAPNSSEQSKT